VSAPIPILLYHAVGRHASPEFAPFTIERSALAAHLDLIAERGYRTMTVAELVHRLVRDGSVPERTVVLTFDDGFVDFATDAWPEIVTRDMTATLYMTAGEIGGRATWLDSIGAGDLRLLDETQLRALHRDGCEIGAHSVGHPSLDCLNTDDARE
jgi:peptidoglycan/xylan/chitin deacetylase (PgdA/CDA1 family)